MVGQNVKLLKQQQQHWLELEVASTVVASQVAASAISASTVTVAP